MFRKRALGALVALLTVGATACSGGDDTSTAGTELRGETLEVAATWTGTEQANFKAVLDEFSRRTGATVKYTSGGDDLPVLLNSRLAGGAPPDVALVSQPGVVNSFARKGQIKELTGPAADAVRANFSTAWQQLGTIDGKLYGLYFKAANKSVIWYRSDTFNDAGAHPPKTWDEFLSASRTLSDSGITPMAVPGADGWTLTDWFENIYLRLAGPARYDQLARHEIAWTDPTVIRSLHLLADYWKTPKAIQGGPRGAVQLKFVQSIADVFGEGAPKSAMLFEGDFVAAEIAKLGRVKVGEQARFFEWPSIDGSKPAVVTAGDQAVAFKDSKAAMALMAFLASPDAATIMAGKVGYISPNRKVDPAAYPDDITRRLATAVVDADLLRFDMSDLTPQAFGGSTSASMWKALQDLLADPAGVTGIAQRLEDAAKKDYGSS
ncbi:ABC transporter substrate-binding protein [Virgisporangium aurantiacum]|uniref:Sugar ABC transporter substrate-binding protein n=1 Tax=Virgisporangium aurantiacum TaxID=175570 RepID=A0A8J3ZDZ7_9ACTN|nr:ABC transporter substrate-binding protein [Virgisporangium aurantiacum]GIJ62434.1 sugar ABC transporter substrate-binding protein [Virgisporangium aurantiacum]